jgi:hypothetical protein
VNKRQDLRLGQCSIRHSERAGIISSVAAPFDPSLVSEAIVVWTGWQESSWPTRDEGEGRPATRFGAEEASTLLSRLKQLEDQFYASNARFTISDLAEAGDIAADEFRETHPEISEDAIRALAWCYTFDFK